MASAETVIAVPNDIVNTAPIPIQRRRNAYATTRTSIAPLQGRIPIDPTIPIRLLSDSGVARSPEEWS